MEYWSPSRRPEPRGVLRPTTDDTAGSEPAASEWCWSIEFTSREVVWLLFLRWLYRQGHLTDGV